MFQWLLMTLLVLAGGGTLCALGVGSTMWSRLLPVLLVMICISGLSAWPFLRRR